MKTTKRMMRRLNLEKRCKLGESTDWRRWRSRSVCCLDPWLIRTLYVAGVLLRALAECLAVARRLGQGDPHTVAREVGFGEAKEFNPFTGRPLDHGERGC